MKRRTTIFVLSLLSIAVSGCDFRDDNRNDSSSPPPPPVPQSYTATLIAVDMVNKDSGQPLVVGGLPAQGGVLTVE